MYIELVTLKVMAPEFSCRHKVKVCKKNHSFQKVSLGDWNVLDYMLTVNIIIEIIRLRTFSNLIFN